MNDIQRAKRIPSSCATIISALSWLMFAVTWASPALAQHTYNGMNYGDAYSKMLVVTNSMQTDMFSAINQANAAKGVPELAGASRITPQEIANVCAPFPCGNEGMANRGGPITQEDIQKLCAPFPCGFGPKASPPPPPPPAPRRYPITATDYKPVGHRILPDALAAQSPGDAKAKEAMRSLANQFLDWSEKAVRKNNVANGYGFLAILSLQVAIGRELKDSEEQQIIANLNNALAAAPQFSRMSARDKQLATEASVISGGVIALLNEQGQKNNDARLKADARQMADSAVAYFFGVRVR